MCTLNFTRYMTAYQMFSYQHVKNSNNKEGDGIVGEKLKSYNEASIILAQLLRKWITDINVDILPDVNFL